MISPKKNKKQKHGRVSRQKMLYEKKLNGGRDIECRGYLIISKGKEET